MRRILERIVGVFASFRLATALFVLLLVVVLIGTLEQQHMSLYEVQKTYFASLYFVYRVFGAVPVPFPGGALLLGVLFLNVVFGGLMRMRWKKSTLGVLIAHAGILMLLVGSFVEYRWSEKGALQLYEREQGARFRSYDDWDLTVIRAGAGGRQWFVPGEEVARAVGGSAVRVRSSELPFEIVLTGFARNTTVRPAPSPSDGIDGVEMTEIRLSAAEGVPNVPGVVVALSPPGGGPGPRGYVRGKLRDRASGPAYAWTRTVAGVEWQVALVRRSFDLPFATRLDRFVHKEHPGTTRPKEFSSYVSVTDGGVARDVHITMNEPLRLKGMTLYQSQWGQDENGVYSVFAVVYNPSDQVPKIACWVIFAGMVLHFVRRLDRHLKAEANRRAKGAGAPVGSGVEAAGSAS